MSPGRDVSGLTSLVGNVLSAPGSFPANALDRLVGTLLGGSQFVTQCGYAQDTATVGDDSAVFGCGARVKDVDVVE